MPKSRSSSRKTSLAKRKPRYPPAHAPLASPLAESPLAVSLHEADVVTLLVESLLVESLLEGSPLVDEERIKLVSVESVSPERGEGPERNAIKARP